MGIGAALGSAAGAWATQERKKKEADEKKLIKLQKQQQAEAQQQAMQQQMADITSQPELTANPTTPDSGDFLSSLRGVENYGGYEPNINQYGYGGAYAFRDDEEFAKYSGDSTYEDYLNNPDVADDVMTKSMNDKAERLRKVDVTPTEFNLWGVHNQGMKGFQEILDAHDNGTPLSNARTKKIKANIPKGMDPTAKNYMSYYGDKFNMNKQWRY